MKQFKIKKDGKEFHIFANDSIDAIQKVRSKIADVKVEVSQSSEHKLWNEKGWDDYLKNHMWHPEAMKMFGPFYGYVCITHPKLGEFYVSGNSKEVRVDGKPWKSIKPLNSQQAKWVNGHKNELLSIFKSGKSYTNMADGLPAELEDDRLSPTTYRKLKEYGYSSEDWKDWTQEQANEVVRKHMQENGESGEPDEANTEEKNEDIDNSSSDAEKTFGELAKDDEGIESVTQIDREMFGNDTLEEYMDEMFGEGVYTNDMPENLRGMEVKPYGFITDKPVTPKDVLSWEGYDQYSLGENLISTDIFELGNGKRIIIPGRGHDYDRRKMEKYMEALESKFKRVK